MTHLLLGAHMSIAGGVSQALDRAASVGSNAVQVFTKNNRQWQGPPIDEETQRWSQEKPAQHICASVSHASYLINLASPRMTCGRKAAAPTSTKLRRAHAYAIPHVVLHPGAHTGSGSRRVSVAVAEALNRIHAEAPSATTR